MIDNLVLINVTICIFLSSICFDWANEVLSFYKQVHGCVEMNVNSSEHTNMKDLVRWTNDVETFGFEPFWSVSNEEHHSNNKKGSTIEIFS